MTSKISHVALYASSLFKNGVETYDTETKTASNLGGAQVYQIYNWKSERSTIHFNNEKFGNVLKELAATLHSLNRVELDSDGNPKKIPGTNMNLRTGSGLLLYTQYGDDGSLAKDCVSRIIEACPELEGYISAVVDLLEEVPELQTLDTVKVPSVISSVPQFMNPKKAIILEVSSGSKTSSQYWSYKNKKTTRKSINNATVADVDINDLT